MSPRCDLDLEDNKQFLFRVTLWLILQYYHTKFGDKNVLWFISSGQIFTDIFNLRCDLDLERSNPFFSRRTL